MLWLLAIGVSMDAATVAMTIGMTLRRAFARDACKVGMAFGVLQMIMPLLGYGMGSRVALYVEKVGHWVVFGILVILGIHMIVECIHGKEESFHNALHWPNLLMLALMTSLDSLAVGMSLALMGGDIWHGAPLFGIIAGSLSAIGLLVGHTLGRMLRRRALLAGGLMLIAVGIHSLF